MPPTDVKPDAVRAELTDILVQVVGCAPDDVIDRAALKDLGVDSLAMVEMADELGRRYDVHLSDDTVNNLRTVGDAVHAVTRHDGIRASRSTSHEQDDRPGPMSGTTTTTMEHAMDPEERQSVFRRLAVWFAVAGAGVGIVLGLLFAAFIGATGLDESTLPPLTLETTPPPTTASPTPTATPTPSEEETVNPDPTLTIANNRVAPGERFTLEGSFPALGGGETLQVQVKDPGEAWDEFPVTTRTRREGVFRTQIYTSRTGEREFRMAHLESDTTTPAVSVRIG